MSEVVYVSGCGGFSISLVGNAAHSVAQQQAAGLTLGYPMRNGEIVEKAPH